MAEGSKKASRKLKFFKFKGLGSLSNLPRSFTLRRSVAPISIRSQLKPDTFEATQDDMVTVPKSPPAYARSSDMYSHMGTMPRPSAKKAQDRQASREPQEGGPEPHLVPQGVPEPLGPEAAKEVAGADASVEDTAAVDLSASAVEAEPSGGREDHTENTEEEMAPRDVHPER